MPWALALMPHIIDLLLSYQAVSNTRFPSRTRHRLLLITVHICILVHVWTPRHTSHHGSLSCKSLMHLLGPLHGLIHQLHMVLQLRTLALICNHIPVLSSFVFATISLEPFYTIPHWRYPSQTFYLVVNLFESLRHSFVYIHIYPTSISIPSPCMST